MTANDSGLVRSLLEINQHLVVACTMPGCYRTRRIHAAQACRLFGPSVTFRQAAQRLRCSDCGARGAAGFIDCRPCTIDLSAFQAREAHAIAAARGSDVPWPLEATLDTMRGLLRTMGGELAGDGPVQWPADLPSNDP